MLKPPIGELVELAGSRYTLVIATSKRARQIIEAEQAEDAEIVVKPLTVAVDEFYNGIITCEKA